MDSSELIPVTGITDRLKYVIKMSKMTQAQFARRLQMDPSNLSKHLSGRLPITESLINRIVVDMNISKAWLKEGVGVPFEKNNAEGKVMLPIYDVDVTAGSIPLSRMFTDDRIIGQLSLPRMNPESIIVRVSGDSMYPTVKDGSYVAIRPIENIENIFWGQIYVVIMEDYRLVKFVRRHSDPTKIILHSANPEYDDMEINRSDIVGLYLVEAVLNYEIRC